jgi:hypothetical protein
MTGRSPDSPILGDARRATPPEDGSDQELETGVAGGLAVLRAGPGDGRAPDARACWQHVLVSASGLRRVRDENRVDRNESKRKAWPITSSSMWHLDPGPSGLCRRDRDSRGRRLQQQ